MQLPVAIHKEDGTVYGVIVPDVPGCHSWGESMEEALQNAKEAIYSHVETLLELGEAVDVSPSKIEELLTSTDYQGAIWGLIEVDMSKLDPTPERVNISLPRYVLRHIDQYVNEHHDTRSGFLARAAMKELEHA